MQQLSHSTCNPLTFNCKVPTPLQRNTNIVIVQCVSEISHVIPSRVAIGMWKVDFATNTSIKYNMDLHKP